MEDSASSLRKPALSAGFLHYEKDRSRFLQATPVEGRLCSRYTSLQSIEQFHFEIAYKTICLKSFERMHKRAARLNRPKRFFYRTR